MSATTWWRVAVAGMSGPLVVELAKLATWHNGRRTLAHWRNVVDWVALAAFVVLDGILAPLTWYSEGAGVSVFRALHVGATSPLIVGAWASAETGPLDKQSSSRRTGRIVQGKDNTDERRSSHSA